MLQGTPSPCDYECPNAECEDLGTTCQNCEEVSKTACAGALAGIQYLADTGSEEDLVSKHDHQALFSDIQVENASKDVSLITANGPVQGRQVCQPQQPQNPRVFKSSGVPSSRKYPTSLLCLGEGAWIKATGSIGIQGKPRTL